MRRHLLNRRMLSLGLALLAFAAIAWPSSDCVAQSDTPGPVHALHVWLGDQCSFVPDLDVGSCCAAHDIAYVRGGNELDRLWADLQFRHCIRSKNRPIVASIYYAGVRLFGWLFYNYH